MKTYTALIIDDEPDIRELIELTLTRMDIVCRAAENLKDALDMLNTYKFDLCLTDIKLPDGEGIEIVKHINKNLPGLPVAVITAFGSMDSAIDAFKAGSFDYISKPVDLSALRGLVKRALKISKQYDPSIDAESCQFIGNSEIIKSVRSLVHKVALSDAPVYIRGESGTGKELVAKMIHDRSSRSDGPFIAINCSAIPADLLESEFFGHKKGSFTGAVSDKDGLFTAASHGTLFLDEIAELPITMQAKLLRAIQERTVRPVGDHSEIKTDVRILSATNMDLEQLVTDGMFRNDLFYRINVIPIYIPPLREHKEDIKLLSEKFIQNMSRDIRRDHSYKISKDAETKLQEYDFPGNVRELENILERAMALSENDIIDEGSIMLSNGSISGTSSSDVVHIDSDQHTDLSGIGGSLEDHMSNIEKGYIKAALDRCKWSQKDAAKLLNITTRSLRYKIKKYNL